MIFVAQPDSDRFARPYLNRLEHDEYIGRDIDEARAAMRGHDIVWIEWANAQCARLLGRRPDAEKVMVRVHDYEIRSGIIHDVTWDHVDLIWCIGHDAANDMRERVSRHAYKVFHLPNALELARWPAGIAQGHKHIGMVSVNMQERKRYDRALDVLALLPDYRLTIRTDPQGRLPVFQNMVQERGLERRVIVEERKWDEPRGNLDMVKFWCNKSHVLSSSSREAFHYTLAEGVACGAAPAIWRWDWGAPDLLYGADVVGDSAEEVACVIADSRADPIHRKRVEMYDADTLAKKLMEYL